MTTRLKRKLNELGVDPSSSKANESFCLIGTPLPPLEKSKDTGEFVPLWKQEVRDEKGRKRLHGAFTGGFSAGYFNTVGSKEGWTPSTFVSSRSDRAKQKAARPEDYMDEEDLAELKDSQQLVDTNEEMDLLGGTQAEMQKRSGADADAKDSMTSAIESALLPPASDSAGARLLKKMGWRQGQGIGPRVTWQQRKLQNAQASSALSAEDLANLETPDDDPEASKHLYAPRDTKLLVFARKDNSHGLGYSSSAGLNEILHTKNASEAAGPKISAGFGLGALIDADEDDLDVYDGGPTANKGSRMAYDIRDGDEEETISIGTRHLKGAAARGHLTATVKTSGSTFRDGRPILAGFVLSEKPVAEDRWFALPDIPKGWRPDPRRVWEKEKENINTSDVPPTKSESETWRKSVTADQRGAILGETPLPAAPRSVFDYLSQKDRDRLKNLSTGASQPLNKPVAEPVPIHIPHTEPHVAKAALSGFQPFTTDPAKQGRYTAYLQSQAFLDTSHPPLEPIPGQTVDEFNKEVIDYSKAAQIFKPISGAMANRFTSAAVIEHGPKAQEGLHTPSASATGYLGEASASSQQIDKKEESPKAHAARMGMYGSLTREAKPWQPAKLLCKRFGVKDPNPEPASESGAEASAMASGLAGGWQPEAALAEADLTVASGGAQVTNSVGNTSKRRDLSNIGLGEDETQGIDTLTYERPSMDIFKAIFASDDEDSDDEGMDSKKDENKNALEATIAPTSPSTVEVAPAASTVAVSVPPVYQQPLPDGVDSPAKVDMGSFRPTFVPRSQREGNVKNRDKDNRDKKEKKKKHGKTTLVSFEIEEGREGAPPMEKDLEHSKKKKKGKERTTVDDDEGMWVEKPPPEAVQVLQVKTSLAFDPPVEKEGEDLDKSLVPPRGRKRAIDFM